MSWVKWLPWRLILRRAARSQGFLDPIELMARLRRFAQPSEVAEPIELVRAGIVFHARGLMNTKVIQNNLDWVWPYWVECQFDPRDDAFIPRAFSVSHINLTHRNWTAVGYPDCAELPIVDPRGLLTPLYDGWSLDGWVIDDAGRSLLPSSAAASEQRLDLDPVPSVTTETRADGMSLVSSAAVELERGRPVCRMHLTGAADTRAWLVLALRPQNPEGVSFIHEVALSTDRHIWTVDDQHTVEFSAPAERHLLSEYHDGDVFRHLQAGDDEAGQDTIRCHVGMATAAALFRIEAGGETRVSASIPLPRSRDSSLPDDAWKTLRESACKLDCPDPRYQFLFDAAVTSLILHSPGDVYPGPYTYKRFWFRDAAFIIHALLCVGLNDRAARALERFPARQTRFGYFRSQEGEWDANGEVLWILNRFRLLTRAPISDRWHNAIERGARWITRKRTGGSTGTPHAGLLPAGFSAEHLGPNDYYYWDDFWGVAGLNAAGALLQERDAEAAAGFARQADDFAAAVDRSLALCAGRLGRPAMPASPYRRLDAGAVGSLAAGYPLQLFSPGDRRLLDCAEFLMQECFLDGAFFQDMVHSGVNAYLTLHVSQVLLRAGDARFLELMDTVADLATPTGQWPEAIHPRTRGGCMGDGHHVWAAAEWVLMIRNCFVREEDDHLVVGAGIPRRWLDRQRGVSFGPAPTAFGSLSITVTPCSEPGLQVSWQAQWHATTPLVKVRLPGFESADVEPGTCSVTLLEKDMRA